MNVDIIAKRSGGVILIETAELLKVRVWDIRRY